MERIQRQTRRTRDVQGSRFSAAVQKRSHDLLHKQLLASVTWGWVCDAGGCRSHKDVRGLPSLHQHPPPTSGGGGGVITQLWDPCPWGRRESDMTERLSLHFTSLGLKVLLTEKWRWPSDLMGPREQLWIETRIPSTTAKEMSLSWDRRGVCYIPSAKKQQGHLHRHCHSASVRPEVIISCKPCRKPVYHCFIRAPSG